MRLFDILLIAITTLLCILACSKRLQKASENAPLFLKAEKGVYSFVSRYYWFLVVGVSLIAVLVRTWQFGTIPYGFNQDEAMAALEGFSLAEHGTDHYGMNMPVYFTAWISSQMNVLLSYIMIPFFKLFGPSIFIARLPLLLFSLLSLYVVFRFSYKLFDKYAALAILFIVAINPWQIMMSRWALEANLFPHLLLYGCYLLYLGLEKKRYTYLSMPVFGVAMYSYGISYYLVPLLLLVLCIYLLCTKNIKWHQALICVGLYALVAWPIFAMMAVNYFKWETIELPFLTIPFFEHGQRMSDVLFFSDNMYNQFIQNFNYTVNKVIFQAGDLPWNSIPEIGPLYFIAIPLFFLGLGLFIKEYRKKKPETSHGVFILLMMLTTAFISGLITNYVNLNRINAIFFPMLFMIGYAVYYICKRFKTAIIPLLLMFSLLFGNFSYAYFAGDHASELGYQFYYGFSDALTYVKDMDYEKMYITSKTQGDYASFVSEIMTEFLLEIDTEYINGETMPEGETLEYGRKYTYQIVAGLVDTQNPNIIYIAHVDELEHFDEGYFNFHVFENYCAVVHKDHPSQ